MELEMETKTCSAKPEASVSREDEHSPLIEVINSSAIPSQAEPVLDVDVPEPGNVQNSKLDRFCTVFCTIIMAVLIYGFFAGICILLISLFYKAPPEPTFHVGSVSVSSLNLSECRISSDWNISFIVKNPKRGHPMFYEAIRILVLYENEYYLSIGNVESFYQRNGQESVVQAWLGGSSVNVEKWVVSAVQADMNTRREMDIALVLDGLVTVNPELDSKYRRRQSVKVSCKYLKLELYSEYATSGSLLSGNSRTNCHLKFDNGT